MNMTTFTDKQLAVMAEESSPRGMSARNEIERRSKQQKAKVETHVQEEDVPEGQQENPKRNTRRKRSTKQEEM
jgi:hypothetical protein